MTPDVAPPSVLSDKITEIVRQRSVMFRQVDEMIDQLRASSRYPERIVRVDPVDPMKVTFDEASNKMVVRLTVPGIASVLPTTDLTDIPEYNEPDAPSPCGEWAVVVAGAVAVTAVAVFVVRRIRRASRG